MSQPSLRAVLVFAPLLVGTVAGAQPLPTPGQREAVLSRQLVLSEDDSGSVPVVRVAPRTRTYIVLDAPILRDSVTLEGEGTRVRLVAKDDTLIAVEGLTELAKDGAVLQAAYADGNAPQVLTLTLVSDPAQVDNEVRVTRRPRSAGALEVELAKALARERAKDAELASLRARGKASGPLGLVLSRLLNRYGLTTKELASNGRRTSTNGFRLARGDVHAAPGWVVLALEVKNLSGQGPWSPDGARLTSAKTGQPVKVRAVGLVGPTLRPGESGLLGIETISTPDEAGEVFRLEVWDSATGRRLVLPDVRIEPHRASGQDVKP